MTTTAIKNLAVMIGQRSLQAAATGYTETNMMIYNAPIMTVARTTPLQS